MRASPLKLQDPQDFSDFYARSQIIIFRFIYGLHGGPVEEVEDLTCDTYLRAWKARHRFSGDDQDALCWLFTIARRLVIDAHRRRKTHPYNQNMSLDEINIETIFSPAQASPEEQAASLDQYRHLWRILQNLSDDKREMLVLRYMLGWKVKQIAEYLHREENTISVYIRRILEQIRQGWSSE